MPFLLVPERNRIFGLISSLNARLAVAEIASYCTILLDLDDELETSPPRTSGGTMKNKRELTPGDHHRTPVLPSDLEGSLRHLDEATFALLLDSVLREAGRRNTLLPNPVGDKLGAASKIEASSSHKGNAPPRENSSFSLPQGQLNAIRAAFRAGVKASTIARQFGVSQSVIKQVIASNH